MGELSWKTAQLYHLSPVALAVHFIDHNSHCQHRPITVAAITTIFLIAIIVFSAIVVVIFTIAATDTTVCHSLQHTSIVPSAPSPSLAWVQLPFAL